MTDRLITIKEIAEKLGVPEAEIEERARRENWPVYGTLHRTTIIKQENTNTEPKTITILSFCKNEDRREE